LRLEPTGWQASLPVLVVTAGFSSPVAINLLVVVIGVIRAHPTSLTYRLLIIARFQLPIAIDRAVIGPGLVNALLLLRADRWFSIILSKNRIKRRRCQQEHGECNDAHDEQIPLVAVCPL
jgi:hypothetical protein